MFKQMPRTPIDDVLAELLPSATTNVKQADALGVDATVLSRIRNGKMRLTQAFAEKLAKALTADVHTQSVYASRFLSAGEHTFSPSASSSSVQRVVELFNRLSGDGNLLCVEYRDTPRAGVNQKYSWLLPHVGSAVVAGMHFAMFQPFGSLSLADRQSSRPRSVVAFEYRVISEIHGIYDQMRAAIRSRAREAGVNPVQAEKRLVLFERNQKASGFGFQSRLFCAKQSGGRPEVYEWVSTQDEDLFVERDGVDPVAVYEQFFEITAYFDKHKSLPQKNADLRDKESLTFMKDNWGVKPDQRTGWTVYHEGRADVASRDR